MRAGNVRLSILVAILALTAVLTACARRPVLSQASAPAPTGASSATAPAAALAPAAAATPQPAPAPAPSPATPSAAQLAEAAPPTNPQVGAAARPDTSPQPSASPTSPPPAALAPPSSATPPPPREFAAVAELSDIHFDFDKYNIRPGDAAILDRNAAWLKSNSSTLVLIEGHCDERGTNEYNIALGERRARSTLAYLVAQGVAAGRISIISYGEERPSCTEHTEDCWAKNRRAHLVVKPR